MRKDISLNERLKSFLDSDTGYATATKVVLAVIALAGIAFVMTAAPNIFQALKVFKKSKRYSDKQLRNAFYTLKRRGFIETIKEDNDKIKVRITKKGKEKIKEFSIDTLAISKPRKWDGKWRVVIFDIPNRFNRAREALRGKLKDLGFFQIQKSVWVHPYPCEDEILFVANIFQIEPFIEILIVEEFLHGNKIRKYFNL
ncbi:MAG: hypothetical protein WC587_02815 [Candidatus Paceibacterota bacterium]